jgi:UDP-N-acetylmuramoyl-tripeptide--D-alanyl-D-alanine ligase
MRAAIAVLGAASGARRLAVLGDMLELGEAAEDFHRQLAESLLAAEVDRVFLVGTLVAALHEALPEARRGGLFGSAAEAIPLLLRFLQPGDVVTVKGSRSVGLGPIVEQLRAASARFEA